MKGLNPMLLSNSNVQWMDVASQEVFEKPIYLLFQMYSVLAKKIDKDVEEIVFPENQIVKITDWQGWTDIISMRKIRNRKRVVLIKLKSDNHPSLVYDPHTLIPVYKSEHILLKEKVKGFHGERRFPFIVKEAHSIDLEDRIRARKIGWWDDREHYTEDGFTSFREILTHINVNGPRYQIETKSGFFNADDIHFWGKYTIPEDYCNVCPVTGTDACSNCRSDIQFDPE